MNHIDDELLAAYALDPAEPFTATDQEHLRHCARCASEFDALRRLAPPNQGADPPLHEAPDHLWDSILADLEAETTPATSDPPRPTPRTVDHSDSRTKTSASRRPGSRAWWAVGLAAALVGILIGVLGTVAIRTMQRPPETVVAEIALDPLPGKAGTGQATLIQTPTGLELRVTLSDISVRDADLEVWLINADGERMRSLGLSGDAGGTFNVPGWLIPDDYRIVDVSVEPHDGNLAHSKNSEVRGTLP